MGQFKQYVESYDPPRLHRAIQVVVLMVLLVRAVHTPTLENVLWAVWMVAFLLMACGAFLLLRFFLNRPHSILIALPAAAALFTYATIRRRRIPIAAK